LAAGFSTGFSAGAAFFAAGFAAGFSTGAAFFATGFEAGFAAGATFFGTAAAFTGAAFRVAVALAVVACLLLALVVMR
jgi:hypothetical protein